jgi:hypothetical protein
MHTHNHERAYALMVASCPYPLHNFDTTPHTAIMPLSCLTHV